MAEDQSTVTLVGRALTRRGWVKDRPGNPLGRFREVYIRGERKLALVSWYDGAIAVYEWSSSLGWLRARMGDVGQVLRWIEQEA